jgi:hypothetical protein
MVDTTGADHPVKFCANKKIKEIIHSLSNSISRTQCQEMLPLSSLCCRSDHAEMALHAA